MTQGGAVSRQLSLNGALISYRIWGQEREGGSAIVLLHGWRSDSSIWSSFVEQLAPSAPVYALDLPGFGGSPLHKESLTLADYTETLAAFAQKLRLEKLILIGHSFGGRVAIRYAATNPQALQLLILIDSAGFVSKKAAFIKPFAKLLKLLCLIPGWRGFAYSFLGAEDYLATPKLRQTFRNIISEDLSDRMKEITVPTLLVWGENDTATPLSFAHTMNRLIPRAKLRIIPKAGHFSFIDDAPMASAAVSSFIASHPV